MIRRNVLLPGEDENSIANLKEALGADFYVSSIDTLDNAARLLQDGEVDLIIMNPKYPKDEKLELFNKIKQSYNKEVFPVIFLTPKPETISGNPGYSNLVDSSLYLPANPNMIVSKVKSYFNKLEEIENSYKLKLDNLRGNISLAIPHEFRTHLTGIMGFSKAISELADSEANIGSDKLSEISEMARLISDSGAKLSRISENFILYSQLRLALDSKDEIYQLRKSRIDNACEIVDEVIMSLADKYGRKADICSQIDESSLNISWYHFYKAIYEILDNALKFSAPNSLIKIVGVEKKEHYELLILDSGRGMTTDQMENIGAYSQFERSKYEQQGAGLGLVIAKTLCQLYEAKFSIHSSVGRGTVVKMKFKLTKTYST